MGMELDDDALADVEGDADLLLRLASLDDEEPGDVVALCRHMTGRVPFLSRMGPEAQLSRVLDGHRVCVRSGLQPGRTRWLIAHELAELHYERIGYRGEDVEARADALGAALAAPRRATRAAMREHGQRPIALAVSLVLEPAAAMLRIGEVAGRSVALIRSPGVIIARGEPFPWPPLRRVLRERLPDVHPIRLGDRWGMMARAA